MARVRVRHPNGTDTIVAGDDWDLSHLVAAIREKTHISRFTLKSGYPPTPLDLTAINTPLEDLRLNGATLILAPIEDEPKDVEVPKSRSSDALPTFTPKRPAVDETSIEWADGGGYMILRVMPDDNSCMFTAFGGVLGISDPAVRVRQEVAEHIMSHPEKYTKVVLENIEPAVYASRIRDPQRWGGSIELECLSEIYDIQICSIDIKYGRIDTYGLEKETRCVLVYSGIHYDRIAMTFDLGLPVDSDVTQWKTDDDAVLEKAKELAAKLKAAQYYTDTETMAIRCEVPGCEHWLGSGERDMIKHQKETGHTAFSEMTFN